MAIIKENVPSSLSYFRFLYNNLLTEMMDENGITDLKTSYGSIIFTLMNNGDLTMKDLAAKIQRDKSTLTVLIKKLEKNGYVRKIDNPDDARSKFITLTEKTAGLDKIFISISKSVNEKIWQAISDEDTEVFIKCLKQMTANLGGNR